MKNITKSSICLIAIISIVLSTTIGHAATDTSIFSIVGLQNTNQAILSYAVLPDTENNRTTTDAYYDLYLNPSLRIASVDTYLNGYIRMAFNFSVSSPSFSISAITISFDNMYAEDYFVAKIDSNYSSDLIAYAFFDNYWCWGASASTLPLNVIHVRIAMYSSTGATPPNYISVGCTTTIGSARYNLTALPQDNTGYANILVNAITEALESSNLDDVYSILNLWKTTQDGYLADIELTVNDLDTILTALAITVGDMYTQDIQTYGKIVDIYNLLAGIFPSYANTVIYRLGEFSGYLQTLINQNASDTAAESQMQNAEQQLSQAVNNMEVSKPNINNVVNAGDQYLSQDITNSQSDTFFWLHGSNILVTILTMAITVGIIGFVIYGKSG